MRPIARREVLLAAAGFAALGATAGCGLPGSSAVRDGLDVGQPLLPPVRFEFEAPQQGATPEQIVRGFLAASWSSEDDFVAARAYLSRAAAKKWAPRSTVTVYGESSALTAKTATVDTAEAEVTITAAEEARLDVDGRYSSRPAGAKQTSVLTLAKVTGEWRITSLEPEFGMWLSRTYFERAYRSFQIAYVDPNRREIIYDHRWFPVGAGLATTLARAQLDPVPPYLASAARTAFPAGSRLAVDSVPVTSGEASIDLTPLVLNVTAQDRRAAWAQMITSLTQVPEVTTVSLQVSGATLDVGTSTLPTSPESLGFSTLTAPQGVPLRRAGERLLPMDSVVSPKNATTTPELPRIGRAWNRIAVSPQAIEVAALNADASVLRRWRGGQTAQCAPFGAHLTAPAYDTRRYLWIGGRDARGRSRVWTIGTASGSLAENPHLVTAEWLAAREVIEVRPAPDGQRALVLSKDRSGALQIGISGVVRGGSDRPLSLTAPWAVGGDVTAAIRAIWVDDATLAVIGRQAPGGSLRPLVVAVGGATEALAAVPEPGSIASSGGGERGIVVASGDGSMYGRVGGGWQPVGQFSEFIVPGG